MAPAPSIPLAHAKAEIRRLEQECDMQRSQIRDKKETVTRLLSETEQLHTELDRNLKACREWQQVCDYLSNDDNLADPQQDVIAQEVVDEDEGSEYISSQAEALTPDEVLHPSCCLLHAQDSSFRRHCLSARAIQLRKFASVNACSVVHLSEMRRSFASSW